MNRYLLGAILVLIFLLFMVGRKALDYRNEANRHESNEYALLNPTQGRVVNLTQEQFEDRLGFVVDSLNRVSKERMRHVKGLTTVKTKIVRQKVPMDVIKYDTVTRVRELAYLGSCFTVSVVDTILSIQFDDTIQIVNYLGKRSRKFLFIRYGKRHEHIKAFSKCGTVEVGSVKVVKD
jgi:DNA-directed RNA polymerase